MGADGINWPTDLQLQSVWEKIELLQAGESILISDFAKKKPDIFLKCCKMFIYCYPLQAELSNDYKRLIKTT